jgi:Tfp pilus assembly protein PilN
MLATQPQNESKAELDVEMNAGEKTNGSLRVSAAAVVSEHMEAAKFAEVKKLERENEALKKKIESLEAAATRNGARFTAQKLEAAVPKMPRKPPLSIRSAPKIIRTRIKALKTEAKSLKAYGLTVVIQQPAAFNKWTASVSAARSALGTTGFASLRRGCTLYKKAKEIHVKRLENSKEASASS